MRNIRVRLLSFKHKLKKEEIIAKLLEDKAQLLKKQIEYSLQSQLRKPLLLLMPNRLKTYSLSSSLNFKLKVFIVIKSRTTFLSPIQAKLKYQ